MNTAIQYFYNVLYGFFKWIFTEATFTPYTEGTVSLGYIFVAIIILGMLIRNVLAIPNKSQGYTFRGDKDGAS